MKAEGIIETVRTTEAARSSEAARMVGFVRSVEIARVVRTGCNLVLASTLFAGLCANPTGGIRWIVQAHARPAEPGQSLPNPTGGSRWVVQVQPRPADPAQFLPNPTGIISAVKTVPGSSSRRDAAILAQDFSLGTALLVNLVPKARLTRVLARLSTWFPHSLRSPWMAQPTALKPTGTAQIQTETQNKNEQPRTVRRPSPIDTIRRSLQRLGYAIDEAKSQPGMVVSTYSDAKKGKVTIVMIYDKRKEVVGFYIYKFGNVDKAVDPVALNKYLLAANDEIIIGGFFVDKEGDIGYKYVSSANQLSLASFEVVYVTMATVALDRRPQIRQLIETGKKEEGAAR